LRGEVKDDCFVRPEIRGDDGTAIGLSDGPIHDFERGFVAQLSVGFSSLIQSHEIGDRGECAEGNGISAAEKSSCGHGHLLRPHRPGNPIPKALTGIAFLGEAQKHWTQFGLEIGFLHYVFPNSV